MSKPVVTRFAPSPTGYLHIGGARTALFNWLFARGRGGKFLLRIEDTDRARSTPEATAAILQGMNWLGLDHDGEIVSQFDGAKRHAEVAEQLLAEGKAYKCFATQEEIAAFRDAAKADGKSTLFRSPWREAPAESHPDAPYVIRIKAPQDGSTVIKDQVQGDVTIRNDQLDDMILLRSDGTPTYMHAVVVDDHDMGISHIIRGVDHLTNAARQALIFNANGWDVPKMAHIPLIHGPDGAKLSKRHGATGAEAYRALGYLPQAMRNYLARLGWSHGDEEIIALDDMIKWFGMDAVGQSASRFDFKKLENLNGHYMRATEDGELMDHWKVYLANVEDGAAVLSWMSDGANAQTALTALPGLKERAKTLVELTESASYLWRQRPLENDEKAIKILTDEARAILADLNGVLSDVSDWDAEILETAVKAYAEDKDLKLGKVAQPLRAALTGRGTSPGIYDVLIALGRDESLARISDQAA